MPDYQPVRLGRLVEQGCTKWERLRTEHNLRQLDQIRLLSNLRNRPQPQSVAHARSGPTRGRCANLFENLLDFSTRKHIGNNREAVSVDRVSQNQRDPSVCLSSGRTWSLPAPLSSVPIFPWPILFLRFTGMLRGE